MSNVVKANIIDLYSHGNSIPQISDKVCLSRSTVRYHLKHAGILRSRSEGIKKAAEQGRLGTGTKGKRRIFSAQHKQNIANARLNYSRKHAKGVRVNSKGYIEITIGTNKGRLMHRVVIEKMLLRKLHAGEIVHHKDKNRLNNDISNLYVMTSSEHSRHHGIESNLMCKRDQRGRYI